METQMATGIQVLTNSGLLEPGYHVSHRDISAEFRISGDWFTPGDANPKKKMALQGLALEPMLL